MSYPSTTRETIYFMAFKIMSTRELSCCASLWYWPCPPCPIRFASGTKRNPTPFQRRQRPEILSGFAADDPLTRYWITTLTTTLPKSSFRLPPKLVACWYTVEWDVRPRAAKSAVRTIARRQVVWQNLVVRSTVNSTMRVFNASHEKRSVAAIIGLRVAVCVHGVTGRLGATESVAGIPRSTSVTANLYTSIQRTRT